MAEQCPYKGLVPYSEEDARYFFGRDRERRQISAALRASRLTVLYGESGAGKSSVLAAGVANDLRDDPEYELVLFRSWREDPMAGLLRAIEDRLSKLPDFKANGNSQDPVEILLGWTSSTHRSLLLVLDQFEEHFQYHADENGKGTLVEELPRLLNRADLPVNFLLSMRGDALSVLDRFKGTIPTIFENLVRVDHLTTKAAKDAVMKPLARYKEDLRAGRIDTGGKETPYQIDDKVAGQVVDEIVAVQGGERERVQTPYLQLVMTRWWEREEKDGSAELQIGTLHTTLGGVKRVVEGHLTDTLAGLDPEEKQTVALVFGQMVTPTGRKIQQTVGDLIGNKGIEKRISREALVLLLGRLVEARVLTTVALPRGAAPDEKGFEFGHDVLAKAALEWSREFRQVQELAEAKKKEADARRQASTLKRLTLALGVFLLLAAMAFAYGYWQRIRAKVAFANLQNEAEALQRAVNNEKQAEKDLLEKAKQAEDAEAKAEQKTEDAVSAVEKERKAEQTAKQEAVNARNARIAADILAAQYHDAVDAERVAETEAQAAAREANKQGAIVTAQQSILAGESDPELSVLLAANAVAATWNKDRTVMPDAEQQLHRAILASEAKQTLTGHTDKVITVAWSRDGKHVATGSYDKTAKIWDATTGKLLHTLSGHTSTIAFVAWSPDGKTLATGGDDNDNTAKLWDEETGQLVRTLSGHTRGVWGVAWSPDGRRIATAGADRQAKIWDVASGKELMALPGHSAEVRAVAWSPDGKYLATGSYDKVVKVWDVQTGKELLTLSGHTGIIFTVAWDPSGKRLASGSEDKTAKVWTLDTGKEGLTAKEPLTLSGHSAALFGLAWSPDSKRLATGSADHTAKVWEVPSGKLLMTLTGNNDYVSSVAWSPDGKQLASASFDKTATIWRLDHGKELLTLRDGSGPVRSAAWSPDGKRLATGSADGTVKIWDAESGELVKTLKGHTNSVRSVAWNPEGTRLATGSTDQTVIVWDAVNGQAVQTLKGHTGSVTSVAWSRDGTLLATGSYDATAKVWDVASGKEKQTLKGHVRAVYSVAWSLDGSQLATGGGDGTVMVSDTSGGQLLQTLQAWDAASGEEAPNSKDHYEAVYSLAWSRSGKQLAAGINDNHAKVWDANSWELLFTLKGHSGPVESLVWSPNDARIATASDDKTIAVWDAAKGKEILSLGGHTGAVTCVAWSPDGKRLASGSDDGTVEVYAMDVPMLMGLARQRVSNQVSTQSCQKYTHEDNCPRFPEVSF